MSKKIAVLITDEFEDSEFTSPAAEFRQAGHEVITIEKEAGKTVKGKKGEASVTIDKAIDDVRPDEFDALLLPGGHSPDYLRGDSRFVDFTRDFVNSGKPVFAICHGPQLLISADVIRGRKLTAVKPIIIDVKNAGAEFYDQCSGSQKARTRSKKDATPCCVASYVNYWPECSDLGYG